MTRLLFDTHALIWSVHGPDQLAQDAVTALERSAEERTTVVVSAISAWEIGLLAVRNRVRFDPDPMTWFKRATAPSLFDVRSVSADDYLAACSLPAPLHQDPADRVLIAQARRHGLTLVTRDAKILAYAEAGHLDALAC